MNVMDSYLAHGNPGLNATQNSVAANGGRIICDHAAPPVGFHYEQRPGTTGSCNLVLKPNATTGSGSGSGSGSSGSGSVGTGSGGAAGSGTSGGVGTGSGGNSTTPATSSVTDQVKAALIVAVILWVVKSFAGKG